MVLTTFKAALAVRCLFLVFTSGLAVVCSMANSAGAETNPMDAPLETVTFGENDTIRGLVGQYLSDPDLWPTVLALNNIASPADLKPGQVLRLPVVQVRTADGALLDALSAIQKATAEGARIFAPTEIGTAIESREAAISQREVGEWREVVVLAVNASSHANDALEISIAQRDRSAEAIVSDVQGDVEGRAPAEPGWSDRGLNDVLVEFERMRTLSSSTTQITFRDLSRLRLNPNSNATIQRMRSDPLTGGEVTKVSLANGDFYALLNQLSDKTSFEIEVPGVETTTNSADFWIKNDESGARFVNFDSPELEILRDGERIALGENQGAVMSAGATQRAEVLHSPRLTAPGLGEIIYTQAANLNWEAFDGAEAYWLEVATDPAFNEMKVSEWGIRDTGFMASGLAPSRYHWRVAALDRLGLPGQWSTAQDFTIRMDNTPPFLTLLSPGAGTIATSPSIEVLGASELDAVVTLNGDAVEVGGDGSFLTSVPLAAGPNTITVLAVDPAGNQSTRSQTVVYRPAASVSIALDEGIPRIGTALASRTSELSVLAVTNADPGTDVVVRGADQAVVVRARVETGRMLQFTVPVDEAERDYRIEVLAPGGTVEGAMSFTGLRDSVPPEIEFDLPPPRATSDPTVDLAGSVSDGTRLEINGTEVPLRDGRFDLTLTLEPGENAFDMVASDATGNLKVVRVTTLQDLDPPDILRVDLGRPQGEGGPIEIVVEARDKSGLRQAAPFVISVGGDEREGFLRCDTASGLCRASLPPEPGELELVELIVEDYAGNAAFE